jgi:hypothetical protein
MKVFISWSGEPSRQVALALRDWMPMVIQGIDLFMSDRDTDAGTRWQQVVASNLEASDFGIVVLTSNNIESRWLHFEAGALSKAIAASHVAPLLYGLDNVDVPPPLGQFQMKKLDKSGMLDLLLTMDKAQKKEVGEKALSRLYELAWPDLEKALREIDNQESDVLESHRSDRSILEEILSLLRTQNQTSSRDISSSFFRALAQRESAPLWVLSSKPYKRDQALQKWFISHADSLTDIANEDKDADD